MSNAIPFLNTQNKRIVNGASAEALTDYLILKDLQNNLNNSATVTGTTTMTGSLAIAPAALVAGSYYVIKSTSTNTGAVTINLNGLGAVNTTKPSGSATLVALVAGDMVAGGESVFLYDGTNLQLVNPATISTAISADILFKANATWSIGNTSSPNLALNICAINLLCANNDMNIGTTTSHSLNLKTNNATKYTISSAGDITMAANETYSIGNTSGPNILLNLCAANLLCAGDGMTIGTTTNNVVVFISNNTEKWRLTGGHLQGHSSNGGDVIFQANAAGPVVAINGSLAATGTNQATAASLTFLMSRINAGALNTGVVLPTPVTQGKSWLITNDTGTAKNIYPGGTDNFAGLGASVATSFAAGATRICHGVASTVWGISL